MNSSETDTSTHWIVSRRFDMALVGIPFVACLLSLFTLNVDASRAVPLWAFLLLIVAADVAHVWATIYITYLDPEQFRRRRLLFLLPIPISFVVSYRLHAHSPRLFWTLLAYVAIYHFIKQQWGFIALYKARAREHRRIDFYLDKWTLWVGALGPVVLWHASPARQFDWFNAGESFIGRLNPAVQNDVLILMVLFAALWIGRQLQLLVQHGEYNPGKLLWMVLSWMSWSIGISLATHPLISAAFLNLFHGVPFIGLVWYRCNRRWQDKQASSPSVVAWLSQRKHWLYFYGVVLALAIVEELLWDGMVWKVYLPGLVGAGKQTSPGEYLSFWVALLSIPQIVHYYLDAWIWKLDGSNPDLREVLSLQRRG